MSFQDQIPARQTKALNTVTPPASFFYNSKDYLRAEDTTLATGSVANAFDPRTGKLIAITPVDAQVEEFDSILAPKP